MKMTSIMKHLRYWSNFQTSN